MTRTIIAGAGLAGLITACAIPNAPIYEAGKRAENHKALLRFRDTGVSDLTGIPFRPVTVRKSIYWCNEHHAQCSIVLANLYARKTTGWLSGDRSIWNLETSTRYIAPENLYDQLADKHAARIQFDYGITTRPRDSKTQLISTIPMPRMMELCGMAPFGMNLQPAPIEVDRYRISTGANVYQTVYFPETDIRTYRASITGDLLIIERCNTFDAPPRDFAWRFSREDELDYVCKAFGLNWVDDLHCLETVNQRYGKIVEIPRQKREAILYELTREFNVFSIGRFATWRNILLDDVVKDIEVVKRLMDSSQYGRELVLASR